MHKRPPIQIIQIQIIQKRDGILGKHMSKTQIQLQIQIAQKGEGILGTHMLKTDNSDVERLTGSDFEQSQMSTHRNSSFVNKRTEPEFTKHKNHIDKVKRTKDVNALAMIHSC